MLILKHAFVLLTNNPGAEAVYVLNVHILSLRTALRDRICTLRTYTASGPGCWIAQVSECHSTLLCTGVDKLIIKFSSCQA